MRTAENHNGLALVAVLWIVAVMTAMIAIVSQTSRLEMKMARGAADEVRCKWACRAGTESAIAILNEDLRDTDCLSDLWSDNAEDLNDVPLERCHYTVQVTDEAGKLNINTITREQLMALPYMEEDIADAVLDWRDNDDNPQNGGVEGGYYENLPIPYTIRNGAFKTVRELLRVKGVTEELLYGEDTNLNGQLDAGEKDGALTPPLDNGDEYLDQGWIAYLTCYSYENNVDADGNARVNINQANEQQLVSQLGLRNPQARWIVQNRGRGYQSIADIISDQGGAGSQGGSGNRNNRSNNNNNNNQNSTEPIDQQTFSQIADRITISGEQKIPGKVNINTASWEVLAALLGGDDQAEQLAHTIVADRSSLLYGFQGVADLLSQQSMSLERFKRIADMITVRSDVFTIRCVATADVGGGKVQTECVVDRSATPGTVLYQYQGANY
jgi:type II secretory pathway component PulK